MCGGWTSRAYPASRRRWQPFCAGEKFRDPSNPGFHASLFPNIPSRTGAICNRALEILYLLQLIRPLPADALDEITSGRLARRALKAIFHSR